MDENSGAVAVCAAAAAGVVVVVVVAVAGGGGVASSANPHERYRLEAPLPRIMNPRHCPIDSLNPESLVGCQNHDPLELPQ